MSTCKKCEELTVNEYQKRTSETAIYPQEDTMVSGDLMGITYCTLGLVGECGEIANKVKKIFRDHGSLITSEKKQELSKELGDVQWYLAQLSHKLDSTLESILRGNLEKLSKRKESGKIGGSGDNR